MALAGIAAALIAALAVGSHIGKAAEVEAPRVTRMRLPEGGIQPQAVTDARGGAHVLYFKGEPRGGDLFYVRLEPGKDEFSAPIRVNSQPGSAVAAGTIRGGQIAVGKGGRIHAAWNGSGQAMPRGLANPKATQPGHHGGHGGSPMLYTRLNDAGTAFEPQRNLMQLTFALDGGGTVAADPAGNVYIAWHAADGSGEGEQGRRMWVARSKDDGKTFSREAAAWEEPTGACACCGTRAFADRNGTVYLLYRSASTKTDRDMYLLVSKDRGDSYQGSLIHRWKVPG
jgi:hypothetical protein